MQNAEKIISVILSEAKEEASSILANAEQARDKACAELSARLESENALKEKNAKVEAENVITRRLTVAGLDARMQTLSAKQAVISEAYELAFEKIKAVDKARYKALFAKLLASVAKAGDEIIVADSDKDVLDAKWLESVSVKLGKKLKLSSCALDAKGGLVVSGTEIETDLTLETLVAEVREKREAEVLAQLFGG
ncbi:MAG: V-type ATP synthase subunit E [Clostridia bacterium]|nr:V-type ATP synthase subunit E [Clostridia bacterium]